MILVVTGTDRFPFDRLVRAVDRGAEAAGVGQEVLVQVGSSEYQPASCRWTSLLAFDEFLELLERAEVVVGHAGAGTVLLCLERGLRPVVMPRKRSEGECVDDHQLLFARRLHELGLVRCVTEAEEVWPAIEEARRAPAPDLGRSEIGRLIRYLEERVTRWTKRSR